VISNSHARPATGTSSLSRPQGETPLEQGQRTQSHVLLTNAWVAAALVSTVTPSLARCLTRVWARVPWPQATSDPPGSSPAESSRALAQRTACQEINCSLCVSSTRPEPYCAKAVRTGGEA
jgi:hypothetical protein